MDKRVWRKANKRLVVCALLFVAGAVISSLYGNVRNGNLDHKIIAFFGVLAFIVFAVIFLHILTNTLHRIVSAHLKGANRAATIRFILRTVGYIAIILIALELLDIPVGKLLLGGAVLGIILGVAAQQALANFFASIIIILSRPFKVGDYITINSGALGGKHTGRIVDIGLTHTRMQEKTDVILLPNATILSSSAIMSQKTAPAVEPDHSEK